jgi:hypothetical protein
MKITRRAALITIVGLLVLAAVILAFMIYVVGYVGFDSGN